MRPFCPRERVARLLTQSTTITPNVFAFPICNGPPDRGTRIPLLGQTLLRFDGSPHKTRKVPEIVGIPFVRCKCYSLYTLTTRGLCSGIFYRLHFFFLFLKPAFQGFSRVTTWPAGRVKRFLKPRGSTVVGSGQEVFEISRVGSGRLGSARVGLGRVRSSSSLADRVESP